MRPPGAQRSRLPGVALRTLALALAVGAGVLGGAAGQGGAHGYRLGDIAVGHVWMPPAGAGEDAPVYGPILNGGDEPARLVGASTGAAGQVRIRRQQEGTVGWPEALELPPNRPVALAPWREHLWLTGLRRDLRPGDSLELVLDFGPAGELPVTVVVEKSGGH